VIAGRADSTKPNMGLTTWTGSRPGRADVGFAKNYLSHEDIETLTSHTKTRRIYEIVAL
jgi:hypothetical protein